jgi:hypothetical protein
MPTDTIWITALTGGLAGALLTLLGRSLLHWWNRPILEIVFRDEAGCIVPIRDAWVLDKDKGTPRKDKLGNPRRGNFQYLRLKIEDRGKTFAKNASVCVTQITYEAAGTGKKSFAEEVFELSLAPTAGNRLVFNLAAGGHRFMDFVHTEPDDENQLKLVFDFGPGTWRLDPLNLGAGSYVVTVFASAANAQSIKRDLHWSCGKTWDSLKIDRPLPADG